MYDSFSADYDRFVSWPGRLAFEMPFIEMQIRRSIVDPARRVCVLDAAAGTGMHVVELARRGYSARGADLSSGMIERAQANAKAANMQVGFKVAGWGGLAAAFGREAGVFPFDAVLCLGNSIPHLLDIPALKEAMADFADCLRPGGILLVQNRNFDRVLAQRERWMEPQSHCSGDEEWVFLRFYDFRPDGILDFNIVTLYRNRQENWTQTIRTAQLYPLRKDELFQALAGVGFREIEFYGSMAGEPFDAANSGNLVAVARKP